MHADRERETARGEHRNAKEHRSRGGADQCIDQGPALQHVVDGKYQRDEDLRRDDAIAFAQAVEGVAAKSELFAGAKADERDGHQKDEGRVRGPVAYECERAECQPRQADLQGDHCGTKRKANHEARDAPLRPVRTGGSQCQAFTSREPDRQRHGGSSHHQPCDQHPEGGRHEAEHEAKADEDRAIGQPESRNAVHLCCDVT